MASARQPDPHQDIWDEVWEINYGKPKNRRPDTGAAIPKLEALCDRLRVDGAWTVDVPTAGMVLSSLATCYVVVGEWKKALETFDQVEDPEAPNAGWRFACLWKVGRRDEAEKGFRSRMKQKGVQPDIWFSIHLMEEEEPEKEWLVSLIREGLPPHLAKRAKNATVGKECYGGGNQEFAEDGKEESSVKPLLRFYLLVGGFFAVAAGLFNAFSGRFEPDLGYRPGSQYVRSAAFALFGVVVLGATSYGWWKERFRGKRDDLL